MLDLLPEVKNHLETVLPVYYEDPEMPVDVPCITYFLYNSMQRETGDTQIYSNETFCVKV